MAEFRLTKPYTMPIEEARSAAQGLAASLEREHGVRSRWDGDTVYVKGSGIDGRMSLHDGIIDVSVRLGILAGMFEPVLKREVQRYLDSHVC